MGYTVKYKDGRWLDVEVDSLHFNEPVILGINLADGEIVYDKAEEDEMVEWLYENRMHEISEQFAEDRSDMLDVLDGFSARRGGF